MRLWQWWPWVRKTHPHVSSTRVEGEPGKKGVLSLGCLLGVLVGHTGWPSSVRGGSGLGLQWDSAGSLGAMRENPSTFLRISGQRPTLIKTHSEAASRPKSKAFGKTTAQAQPPVRRQTAGFRGLSKVRRKGRQAPASMLSRGRRSRKRDGVRGGGAIAARGRGGGARCGVRGCCLGGRPGSRGVARLSTWRGSGPDGCGWVPGGGRTVGRRRRGLGAEPGDLESERVRLSVGHSVGPLNEVPAPLSPEPGAFPARWTVSPAASVSTAGKSSVISAEWEPCSLHTQPRPCSPPSPWGW